MKPSDLTTYLATRSPVERELQRLFSRRASPVIFDVGACEGEESIRYARLFPRARIFTFEPLPANQQLIRANFERYGVSNAELVPVALSDRIGEASFHVSSGRPPHEFSGADWNYGNKSSSLLPPADPAPMYGWIEFKEAIVVRTDTLDRLCADRGIERIDFMHLDVQGAEHLVLAGATSMLPRTASLWLEVSDRELYRGQRLRGDIEDLLRRHGFSLAFEERREIEGDQFYVNRRFFRSRRYLGFNQLRRAFAKCRQVGGKIKARLIR